MSIIARDFYNRPALEVARDLLGCRLVRIQSGQRLSGLIMETEAYQGESDLGCHASAGKTPRTEVMYGPPGHAYVYFTYGMHWMFNVVTEPENSPSAVLIRGILPTEGTQIMAENRPYNAMKTGWTDGPAKLTQALNIDKAFNAVDLCTRDNQIWIESGDPIPEKFITQTARIGLNSVPEFWSQLPWRFVVDQGAING
jgi:DNA-3-methyladenine glycosylase